MKSAVIIFPGSNCDRDMDVALKKFGFKNKMVWHNDQEIPKSDLIVLPGGFSYGDYLRCGSIAGKSKIIKSVVEFANSGGLVLGICNGFQILTETGLLKGTLLRNKNLKFIFSYNIIPFSYLTIIMYTFLMFPIVFLCKTYKLFTCHTPITYSTRDF